MTEQKVQNPIPTEVLEIETILTKEIPGHNITNEEKKEDLHPKLEANLSKEKVSLNERNLHLYASKEIEASILEFKAIKFKSKIEGEDVMIEIPEVTDETLRTLAKVIRSAHKTHTLNIDCSRCPEITDKGLEYLCESIKGTSLRHISLNFKRCNKITDDGFSILHHALKDLISLQELSLSFKESGENKIGDSGISKLGETLQLLTSLQRLRLEFLGFQTITSQGFHSLSEKLSSLASLQSLYLNFQQYDTWTDRDDGPRLEILSQELKKLVSLQDLHLDFSCCKEITDKEMQDLAQSLGHLTSLRNISLDFSECYQIKQEGLEAVNQALEKLTSLQSIRLNFKNCRDILDAAMESFGKTISSLSSLKNLALNFSGYNAITSTGMGNLAQALNSLSSLERISLIFSSLEITGAEMNQLSQALAQQTLLKDITLHFNSCNKITLVGFENLCLSFQKLASLQSLDLEFQDNELLSDSQISHLIPTLKFLSGSLRSLRLSFAWELNQLTKKRYPHDWKWNGINLYICELAQVLTELPLLKSVSLHFPNLAKICDEFIQPLQNLKTLESFKFRCEEIQDEELVKLTEAMRTLPLLQKFGLIAYFYDVSEECIDKFGQILQGFSNLQHIFLRLNMYSGETEEILRQTLKTIPCLKSLSIEIQDW